VGFVVIPGFRLCAICRKPIRTDLGEEMFVIERPWWAFWRWTKLVHGDCEE